MTSIALFAAAESQSFHQFSRFQSLTEWWQWFVLALISAAILTYVVVLYRRDSAELSRGQAWGLCLLRLVAWLGILFYFLDLEKREERKLVRNSRAIVLVDTSLSMGIQDHRGASTASSSGGRRIDALIDEFARGSFLESLRGQHDVTVYRFDQQTTPAEVAAFPRIARSEQSTGANRLADRAGNLRESRTIAAIAAGFLVLSLVAAGVYWVAGTPQPAKATRDEPGQERDGSWTLLVSMVSLICGMVILGVACLRHPELEFAAIVAFRDAAAEVREPAQVPSPDRPSTRNGEAEPVAPPVNWPEALAPRGVETRIGDAIRAVVNKERGGPIAGIVLATDGGNNAGSEISEGIAAVRSAGIPVFTIGLGSELRPTNVRLVDVEVSPRVFPGDAFPITGFLQAFNLRGRTVKVELSSSAGKSPGSSAEQVIEETRQVTLGSDGELMPLRFEVTPQQAGIRDYRLRVTPPAQDTDDRDNERSASVQIVERKNRVLLFTGAAMRDFQLLRNLLFRDKETTVDVFLQSAAPGISQESDELLFEFPKLAEELFAYDVLVAFDPDWTQLDDLQVELLERWVAEKAGGLVVVAGPVDTPKLTNSRAGDTRLATIRGLYPVVFFGRSSATLSLSRNASETPWPLQFTRDGQEAEFLRLDDDPLENERVWSSFPGMYGYFSVKDVKPGAKVFARFSDPSTAVDGTLPVYLAGHFYGAGRVVYQGSGEMWRLRQGGDAYFDRYYTKLIRWVSQGRLLRDSSRGVLLVDKDRCLLGDTISVQAILNDSQQQPLTVAEVSAVLVLPDGRRTNLLLRRVDDAARPGMYSTQFTAALEGDFRIELSLPSAANQELLTREVRSRIPALETEKPERNDSLLTELAEKTGAQYFIGFSSALDRGTGRTPLATLLEPQDQTTYLPGSPDKDFDRLLMTWLMGIICGALCLEWLIRRLNKLA